MHLSRVTLVRGAQRCVLQGMIHIAPKALYTAVQHDMDTLVQKGYQVFFEGVNKEPAEAPLNENEARIREFLGFILELYPVLASSLGVVFQPQHIAYPADAVNADITFSHLTRKLDENGFTCDLLLSMIRALGGKEKLRDKKAAEIRGSEDAFKEFVRSRSRKSVLGRICAWILLRKAVPVVLGYRNSVAVRIMRECSANRDCYMLYGDRHIPGLVDLLVGEGWAVTRTDRVDLLAFCGEVEKTSS